MKNTWTDTLTDTIVRKIDIREISCDDFEAAYFLMSGQRKAKCDSFRNEKDKKLCIAADMLLREALAELTGMNKNEFAFEIEENGKPYLKNGSCHFNISHSGDFVVVAVNKKKSVGIDIEYIRPIKKSLISRVCNDKEIEYIFGNDVFFDELIQKKDICERFFRVWTYKEAYLKCTGEGIVNDLKKNTYGEKEFFCEIIDDYCITVITE